MEIDQTDPKGSAPALVHGPACQGQGTIAERERHLSLPRMMDVARHEREGLSVVSDPHNSHAAIKADIAREKHRNRQGG